MADKSAGRQGRKARLPGAKKFHRYPEYLPDFGKSGGHVHEVTFRAALSPDPLDKPHHRLEIDRLFIQSLP